MFFQVEKMHRTNQKELKNIATNWSRKAKNVFTLACVLDYIELLLREYVVPRYHSDSGGARSNGVHRHDDTLG